MWCYKFGFSIKNSMIIESITFQRLLVTNKNSMFHSFWKYLSLIDLNFTVIVNHPYFPCACMSIINIIQRFLFLCRSQFYFLFSFWCILLFYLLNLCKFYFIVEFKHFRVYNEYELLVHVCLPIRFFVSPLLKKNLLKKAFE